MIDCLDLHFYQQFNKNQLIIIFCRISISLGLRNIFLDLVCYKQYSVINMYVQIEFCGYEFKNNHFLFK